MAESVVAQVGPFAEDVEKGRKYFWCACGRSKNQPYCDGSHQGTGINPVAFTADASETVYLCGCKRTGESPFCDGTHSTLKE